MGETDLRLPSAGHEDLGKYVRADRIKSWLASVLLLTSVLLNVAFAAKIRELRSPKSIDPVTGVSLAPFHVTDLEGRPQLLTFSDATKPTVLYVLSPSCHWCARNFNNISALAARRRDSYRFIGIAVNVPDLRVYAQSTGYAFPIYSIPSYDVIKGLAVGGTPHTLVISAQGVVIRNWIGAFTDNQQKDIEAYFVVNLPGLAPEIN